MLFNYYNVYDKHDNKYLRKLTCKLKLFQINKFLIIWQNCTFTLEVNFFPEKKIKKLHSGIRSVVGRDVDA